MIARSVPEIEGGSPEREGEGEGLVLEYSSSWMMKVLMVMVVMMNILVNIMRNKKKRRHTFRDVS